MSGGPILDIFRSEAGIAPRWVGNADGLESAHVRMKQVSVEKPGRYFVWDAYLRRVIDTIDSTGTPRASSHAAPQGFEVPFLF
jgi:hypothetical protein